MTANCHVSATSENWVDGVFASGTWQVDNATRSTPSLTLYAAYPCGIDKRYYDVHIALKPVKNSLADIQSYLLPRIKDANRDDVFIADTSKGERSQGHEKSPAFPYANQHTLRLLEKRAQEIMVVEEIASAFKRHRNDSSHEEGMRKAQRAWDGVVELMQE